MRQAISVVGIEVVIADRLGHVGHVGFLDGLGEHEGAHARQVLLGAPGSPQDRHYESRPVHRGVVGVAQVEHAALANVEGEHDALHLRREDHGAARLPTAR